MSYSWPGNVRELENTIERAVVLSSEGDIGPDLLPDHIVGRGSAVPAMDANAGATLFSIMEDCERRIIVDMLEKCGWNQTEAAGALPRPAFHPEPENQTPRHRDQEEEPRVTRRPILPRWWNHCFKRSTTAGGSPLSERALL